MLQDTALGGAFLARERQADLRRTASSRRLGVTLRARGRHRRGVIRLRPAAQPSFVVQPRPAVLRRFWQPDVAV